MLAWCDNYRYTCAGSGAVRAAVYAVKRLDLKPCAAHQRRPQALERDVRIGSLHERTPRAASHAEGFHLHVLLKPCVNLSIHTASDVRPPTIFGRRGPYRDNRACRPGDGRTGNQPWDL